MDTNKDANKVDVQIGGNFLTLVSDQPKDYTMRIAKHVDQQIEQIRASNSRLSMTMCTTLAAVNIASEYFEAQEELKQLRVQSKNAMTNYEPALDKIEELKKTNKKLQEDIDRLKDDLVNSLNTIGDMNKGFSNIQYENSEMKEEILEKDEQLRKIEENLIKLQKENLDLQKKYDVIIQKQLSDRKG